MRNIEETIFQFTSANSEMINAITSYYENNLNLQIQTIEHIDPEEPRSITTGYVYSLKDINKLPKSIVKNYNQSLDTTISLDSADIADILVAHFDTIVTKEKRDYLEKLLDTLATFKKEHLNFIALCNNEKASIVVRFVDYLSISINNRLTIKQLEETLNAVSQNKSSLLKNADTTIKKTEEMISEFSTEDLLRFKSIVEHHLANNTDNEEKSWLNLLTTIIFHLKKHLVDLTTICDIHSLVEALPNLENQIQAKVLVAETEYKDISAILNPLLEITIKRSILDLLEDFEKDVQSGLTDIYKKEKLQLIKELRTLCTEDKDINDLFKVIHSHEKILNKSPLGRYLYQCICWLFNKKIEKKPYQIKLFDTCIDASKATEAPMLSNKNKKHQ